VVPVPAGSGIPLGLGLAAGGLGLGLGLCVVRGACGAWSAWLRAARLSQAPSVLGRRSWVFAFFLLRFLRLLRLRLRLRSRSRGLHSAICDPAARSRRSCNLPRAWSPRPTVPRAAAAPTPH
jgi:hypothetical protein